MTQQHGHAKRSDAGLMGKNSESITHSRVHAATHQSTSLRGVITVQGEGTVDDVTSSTPPHTHPPSADFNIDISVGGGEEKQRYGGEGGQVKFD